MSLLLEFFVLILVLVLLYVFFRAVHSAAPLIINSIAGLVVMFLLNWLFGFGVAINIWSVLIVGIGGFAGLLIVLILHFLGIAF